MNERCPTRTTHVVYRSCFQIHEKGGTAVGAGCSHDTSRQKWYMYSSYTTQTSSMTTPTRKAPRVVVRQDYCDDRCLTQLLVSSSCIFNTSRDDFSMDITYERQVDSCDNIKFPRRLVADTRSLTRRLSARNLASFDDVPAF
jgi:hypothetical protein